MGNLYILRQDIWETIASVLLLNKAIITMIVPRSLDIKLSSSNHSTCNWEEEALIITIVIAVDFFEIIIWNLCDSSTKVCSIRCISVNVEKRPFPRILPMCFQMNMIITGEFWVLQFFSFWVWCYSGLPAKRIKFVCNSLRFTSPDHIFLFSEVETSTFEKYDYHSFQCVIYLP